MSEAIRQIVIPYKPRPWFVPLHMSSKRWKFVCAHRRAGKSVSEINEVIKRAIQNTRLDPPPRYAYVGPSFSQTKDLIWGYLKHYTAGIPGVEISESELWVKIPNLAGGFSQITLYGGAAAYERMRGLYFDGIVMDEYPLLASTAFSTVVRPCLADYRGWGILSGTSAGDDHFHARKVKAETDEAWDVFIIPVTDTTALHPDEVKEMTRDMTAEEYAREMLCSFESPVEGAYYAEAINKILEDKRLCGVPYDPNVPVFTWWDLGIDDHMAIWFVQRVGRELHVIDYYHNVGKGLDHYAKVLKEKRYNYSVHVQPHDIKARELGTGRSRLEVLQEMLDEPIFVCPMHRVEDGITAARSILAIAYFDKVKTAAGFSALKNYQKNKTGKPLHNWASHGADAFRTGSVAFDQTIGYISSSNILSMRGPLRRNVRGRV